MRKLLAMLKPDPRWMLNLWFHFTPPSFSRDPSSLDLLDYRFWGYVWTRGLDFLLRQLPLNSTHSSHLQLSWNLTHRSSHRSRRFWVTIYSVRIPGIIFNSRSLFCQLNPSNSTLLMFQHTYQVVGSWLDRQCCILSHAEPPTTVLMTRPFRHLVEHIHTHVRLNILNSTVTTTASMLNYQQISLVTVEPS
jgi:hypothetical protein